VAERGEHPVCRTLERPSANDRADGNLRGRGRGQGLHHPRQCQDRADAHYGVRGTEDDGVGTGDRLKDTLRGPGIVDTAQLDPEHLVALSAAHEILLELEAAYRGVQDSRNWIVAHRQHGALHTQSAG
jgi:hypothetical protein